MENIQNQSSNINEGKYKTFLKGQEILKTTINSIELDQEKYKILVKDKKKHKTAIRYPAVYPWDMSLCIVSSTGIVYWTRSSRHM